MPNTYPTRYQHVLEDLKELVVDLKDIATDTQENLSEVEAVLSQFYLKQILQSLHHETKARMAASLLAVTSNVTRMLFYCLVTCCRRVLAIILASKLNIMTAYLIVHLCWKSSIKLGVAQLSSDTKCQHRSWRSFAAADKAGLPSVHRWGGELQGHELALVQPTCETR